MLNLLKPRLIFFSVEQLGRDLGGMSLLAPGIRLTPMLR